MGSSRTVENQFTCNLESKKLTVNEGMDADIERDIQAASRREKNTELRLDEKIVELMKLYPTNAALYSLGKRATVHGLATFKWEERKGAPFAQFDFVRFWNAPGADRVNDEDELAFLRAIHVDLRDGLQPPTRRYEGDVITRVTSNDLARQALYARAGYADFGSNDSGDKHVFIRRY